MFARCQFGRSRFSRCCNLIFDLAPSFEWRVGPGDCLSRRNSAVETRQFRSWSPVLRSVGAGCGVVRRPHRSPTVDEAVWPTSVPPPPPLVSSHSCRRARPVASRRRPAFIPSDFANYPSPAGALRTEGFRYTPLANVYQSTRERAGKAGA
jgi:hypothetical protein